MAPKLLDVVLGNRFHHVMIIRPGSDLLRYWRRLLQFLPQAGSGDTFLNRSKAASQRAVSRGSYCSTAKELRTISRASAIEPTVPAATACIIRLPMAVASTGPATTGRPVASAVAWHKRRF